MEIRTDLTDLGLRIVEDGPTAHHDELVALARLAREHLVAPASAGVLADRDAPTVVRQRAFAVVAAALAALSGPTPGFARRAA
jgi:hypothetical protein